MLATLSLMTTQTRGSRLHFRTWKAPESGSDGDEASEVAVRVLDNTPDLEDFVHDQEIMEKPKEGVLDWIETVYRESRGFELGTFSSSLLPVLMKKQAEKWRVLHWGTSVTLSPWSTDLFPNFWVQSVLTSKFITI